MSSKSRAKVSTKSSKKTKAKKARAHERRTTPKPGAHAERLRASRSANRSKKLEEASPNVEGGLSAFLPFPSQQVIQQTGPAEPAPKATNGTKGGSAYPALIQTLVSNEAKEKIKALASKEGISTAAYLRRMVLTVTGEGGA